MIYSPIFFLFTQFLLIFANGAQILVEIEPNWMPLPEYRSLLEPEEHREVFQSKRFELQIYKEAIQEGISIAGTRVAKDRDIFRFENIPEDWMEPTGVVLEIKLPPILIVKKILLNEESFYQPRIRRPFRILRNKNMQIYRFTILENPERIFRTDIQLPMGGTPTGGNEVAYMESLNNSLTKLEQSEQLCAQTKYECNLNLLLKYTHISRQFDAFRAACKSRTLTVSTQNFATIRAKSEKLFDDIVKLAVRQIGEEKKIFKENASSSIDLLNFSSPVPPTLHSHSQHQHGLDSSQSSRTQQTPTSGTTSSAAAGVLPVNRKINFMLMSIERIAQFLAGLHPLTIISQPNPNQINIQSANVPVGQQQRVVGQISHGGPSAAQVQEKGKEKADNVVQPPTNVEAISISSSEENDPNPMARANIPAAGLTINDPEIPRQNVPAVDAGKKKTRPTNEIGDREREFLWKHLVRFAAIWTSPHDPSDYTAHGEKLVREEQQERFELTNELGLKREQSYRWFFTKRKDLLKNKEKTRKEFENWKKKYYSEMAAAGVKNSASASASRVPQPTEKTSNVGKYFSIEEIDRNPQAIVPFVPAGPILNAPIDVRPINWRPPAHDKKGQKRKHSSGIVPMTDEEKRAKNAVHGTRFDEDQTVDVERQNEETREQVKLSNSIGLTLKQIYHWIHNIKLKLSNNSETVRKLFEYWKSQSEMAANIAGGGKDKASASVSAPAEIPPAVDLNLNLEQINPEEEDIMQEDD